MKNVDLKNETPTFGKVLLGAVNNLKLVGSNKGFNVYFNANDHMVEIIKKELMPNE